MADTADSFQGFKAFYDCHDLSDLTVVCGDRKWKVHKLVMSANSSFFKKACTGQFKEAKNNTIELKEDDEHVVAAMIYYLYHGTYDVKISSSEKIPAPAFHLKVYLVGDKYAVNGLGNVAKIKLFAFFDSASWLSDISAETVEAVYNTELPDNRPIRGKMLALAKYAHQDLFAAGALHHKFQQVARSTPQFMFELIQTMSDPSVPTMEDLLSPETSRTQLKPVEDLRDDEVDFEINHLTNAIR